jgi:hypothetical protein
MERGRVPGNRLTLLSVTQEPVKRNPHEYDKIQGPLETGKDGYGYPHIVINVPLAEIFSRKEINRLDQLRKEIQKGRIDAPNARQPQTSKSPSR